MAGREVLALLAVVSSLASGWFIVTKNDSAQQYVAVMLSLCISSKKWIASVAGM